MPDTQRQPSSPAADAADVLIRTVRSTVTNLRQQDVDRLLITLDSALDDDLGLDSLARVELFMRVERLALDPRSLDHHMCRRSTTSSRGTRIIMPRNTSWS